MRGLERRAVYCVLAGNQAKRIGKARRQEARPDGGLTRLICLGKSKFWSLRSGFWSSRSGFYSIESSSQRLNSGFKSLSSRRNSVRSRHWQRSSGANLLNSVFQRLRPELEEVLGRLKLAVSRVESVWSRPSLIEPAVELRRTRFQQRRIRPNRLCHHSQGIQRETC